MPCTALAVCGGEGGMGVNIVTGGEDGRITVLRTNDLQPLTVIGVLSFPPFPNHPPPPLCWQNGEGGGDAEQKPQFA